MNDAQRKQRIEEMLAAIARAETYAVEADAQEERGWFFTAAVKSECSGAAYENAGCDAIALQDEPRAGALFALAAAAYERSLALCPTARHHRPRWHNEARRTRAYAENCLTRAA